MNLIISNLLRVSSSTFAVSNDTGRITVAFDYADRDAIEDVLADCELVKLLGEKDGRVSAVYQFTG